jgi:hypothetical protein
VPYHIKYCTKCGYVGAADIVTDRHISVGLLLVLLVLGIIPGIIYVILGGSSVDYWQCVSCRGRLCLIPADSPEALRMLAARTQTPATALVASGKRVAFSASQPVSQFEIHSRPDSPAHR